MLFVVLLYSIETFKNERVTYRLYSKSDSDKRFLRRRFDNRFVVRFCGYVKKKWKCLAIRRVYLPGGRLIVTNICANTRWKSLHTSESRGRLLTTNMSLIVVSCKSVTSQNDQKDAFWKSYFQSTTWLNRYLLGHFLPCHR